MRILQTIMESIKAKPEAPETSELIRIRAYELWEGPSRTEWNSGWRRKRKSPTTERNTEMKKIIALLTIAVAALAAYSHKLKTELETVKEVKAVEILGVMNEREEMYTKLPTGTLPEPSGTEWADVLERIKMLREHLSYQPSPEWIQNVITAAETEIKGLRGDQPKEFKATSYHPHECTRHMR